MKKKVWVQFQQKKKEIKHDDKESKQKMLKQIEDVKYSGFSHDQWSHSDWTTRLGIELAVQGDLQSI